MLKDQRPPKPAPARPGSSGSFTFDLVAHLYRQRDFSIQTFGPDLRTTGVINHIRSELDEIAANPLDVCEWIDVVLLALDGALRTGATPKQIADTLLAKQCINENRSWPDWRSLPEGQPIEHLKSPIK